MRNNVGLTDIAKVLQVQGALAAASEAALARAVTEETERNAAVNNAERALQCAIEDWRHALGAHVLDINLVQLHAQEPVRRDADLATARTHLQTAQRRTATQTQTHARSIANVAATTKVRNRLARLAARKADERVMAAMEQRTSLGVSEA